ncbi:MAG: PEP-CTERM sorting domain-containing protein [Vicinamibacterales bacterium]
MEADVVDCSLVREGAFAFEGSIAAFLDASRTGTPLFSTHLTGDGLAQVFFGMESDQLLVHDLDYRFEAGDPVPEPSSMLLIGTGIALGVRRFRRRRGSPDVPRRCASTHENDGRTAFAGAVNIERSATDIN